MRTGLVIPLIGLIALVGLTFAFATDGDVSHGREVYAVQKCSLCHSIGGVGGNKFALDNVGSKVKPEDIKKWIRTPKDMKAGTIMKPYPNLPDRDLNDLTAYLLTLR
jgi:cytochrome c2